MEDFILKLVNWFNVVNLLPDKMGRVIVNTKVWTVDNLENFSPVCRRCHNILSARPFIICEKHRTVFNTDLNALFLCVFYNWRPYFFENLQIFCKCLIWNSSNKCSDHVNIKHCRCIDQFIDVINVGLSFFKIRIHSIWIIAK